MLYDSSLVQGGMLYAMEADLQKRVEKKGAYEIIIELKAVYAPQAKAERYEASELFFSAKMEEHSNVSAGLDDGWVVPQAKSWM